MVGYLSADRYVVDANGIRVDTRAARAGARHRRRAAFVLDERGARMMVWRPDKPELALAIAKAAQERNDTDLLDRLPDEVERAGGRAFRAAVPHGIGEAEGEADRFAHGARVGAVHQAHGQAKAHEIDRRSTGGAKLLEHAIARWRTVGRRISHTRANRHVDAVRTHIAEGQRRVVVDELADVAADFVADLHGDGKEHVRGGGLVVSRATEALGRGREAAIHRASEDEASLLALVHCSAFAIA